MIQFGCLRSDLFFPNNNPVLLRASDHLTPEKVNLNRTPSFEIKRFPYRGERLPHAS